MGAGPSQMPEEGAGPLPSPPFPSPAKGIWGEIQAGEGAGPQSVGVVLGIKGYGEQEPDQGQVGEGHKDHLPESTALIPEFKKKKGKKKKQTNKNKPLN